MPSRSMSTLASSSGRCSGPQPLLQLAPGDLEDAVGEVEVAQVPAPQVGDDRQAHVGVDGRRVADGVEQGDVVEAVAVGVRVGEVDVVFDGPGLDGLELAAPPHQRSVDDAGERAVDRLPLGGHDRIEPEQLGERRHERRRAGGGHHQDPAGLAVLVDDTRRVRLDLLGQLLGGGRGCRGHRLDGPAGGGAGRQPRRRRGDGGLAQDAEGSGDGVGARHRPALHAGGREVVREGRTGRPADERAVEVEDGGGLAHPVTPPST